MNPGREVKSGPTTRTEPAGNIDWTAHRRPRPWRRPAGLTVAVVALLALSAPVALASPIRPVALDGFAQSGPQAISSQSAAPGAYVPLTPTRLVDTRYGTGTPHAQIPAQSALILPIAGRAGIPATGVGAVSINVDVVNSGASGRVIVYADGTPRPNVSSVNFSAGIAATSQVVSRISGTGRIDVWNSSAKPIDVVIDINGYWVGGTVSAPGGFVPIAPSRSLDTRSSVGAGQSNWVPVVSDFYNTLSWQVSGRNGVPSGATAVLMAVTATNVTGSGQLIPFEDDQSFTPGVDQAILNGDKVFPEVTGMTFTAGQPTTTVFEVPLSASGGARLDLRSDGDSAPGTDVLGDVLGYIVPGAVTAVGMYQSLPVGFLTRQVVPAGATVDVAMPVAGGSAVSVSLTVDSAARSGGVVLFESGTARPATRTVSFTAGQRVSNTATVRTSSGSKISVANISAGSTSITLDVLGYGRATTAPAPTVWAWGSNAGGGMGVGYPSAGSNIAVPVGLTNVKAVTSSDGSSYAITGDGSLWAWGSNSTWDSIFEGGQLGIGDGGDQMLPVKVPSLHDVAQIDAMFPSAYARMTDGTVAAWGGFADGEVDSPAVVGNLTQVVWINGRRAVKSDGTVWEITFQSDGTGGCAATGCFTATQVPGLSGIRQLAGSLALRTDGVLESVNGSAPPVVIGNLSGIKTLAGKAALLTDGTLWLVPTDGGNTAVQVPGLTGVTTLGAYAVKADGSVWSFSAAGATRLPGLPPAAQIPPAKNLVVSR